MKTCASKINLWEAFSFCIDKSFSNAWYLERVQVSISWQVAFEFFPDSIWADNKHIQIHNQVMRSTRFYNCGVLVKHCQSIVVYMYCEWWRRSEVTNVPSLWFATWGEYLVQVTHVVLVTHQFSHAPAKLSCTCKDSTARQKSISVSILAQYLRGLQFLKSFILFILKQCLLIKSCWNYIEIRSLLQWFFCETKRKWELKK